MQIGAAKQTKTFITGISGVVVASGLIPLALTLFVRQ